MFAIGFGFLVLFSALCLLVGNDDQRRDRDPRDDLAYWARFGAR